MSMVSPPPKVSKDITNRYLTGIGQIEDKVVLLLDVAKILSENELTEVHETAAQNKSADETDKRSEIPVVDPQTAATKKNKGE